MKHILYFALSVLLVWGSSLNHRLCAQSPRLYANLQGLADTRINHVTFDSDNFLWVSTTLGLSRFDGQSFTNYTNDPGNPFALRDNHVTFMHEAPDGSHWVGASDGLYFFCRTENSFTRYVPDWVDFTINITGIINHPTRPNHLIMSSAGYGLWVFDTQSRTFDRDESIRITMQLQKRNITLLVTDKANHLWTFFHNGFRVIDLETPQIIKGAITDQQENQMIVQSVVSDPLRNCVYLGTADGLYRAMLPEMKIEELDIDVLRGKNITALCLNPQAQLVVGTEGQGLYQVNPYTLETHAFAHESCPIDLAHAKIHSVTYNKQRDLCLGIYQKGILIWPSQNSLFSYTSIHSNESVYNMGCVTAFATHTNGSRVYGVDGGGIVVKSPDGHQTYFNRNNSILESDAIMDLVSAPDGNIYIATYLHGAYVLDLSINQIRRLPNMGTLSHTSIMTLAYDAIAHNLYLGTNGDGVYRYNTSDTSLEHISTDEGHRWVVKLYIDRNQQLWCATEGSVARYNISQKEFNWIGRPATVRTFGFAEGSEEGEVWFATDKGLYSYDAKLDSMVQAMSEGRYQDESFMAILRSDDNRLWLSSNYGLVSYNPHDQQTTHYTDLEIASIGSFCARSAIKWQDGSFTFGGDNGIVSFVPEKVTSYSRPRQPINFTRLWINNEPVDYNPNLTTTQNVLDAALWKASKLTLPPTSNNFSISFSLQEYIDPLGVHYSYMLEGYDKKWVDVHGFTSTANYTSLPAGNYTFRVKATSGGADSYDVVKTISVEVLPFWYATWWAQMLYALLILVSVSITVLYFINRQQNRQELRRAEQNRKIKEAKLKMFASVSHEIQTPITLLIAPLRQLMNRKNDNATRETLELIYRNALRILMLVNQQLDIRRLDRGLLQLHMHELNIVDFISEQLRFFDHIAKSRQINVQFSVSEEYNGLKIWADKEQIDKVFFNLLSNAFKFTPEQGEVRVDISTADDNQCYISIFNSGSHLSEKDQAEAFSGIGLGLARELTELHHGTLAVTDSEHGVTFTIALPLGNEHLTEEEMSAVQHVGTDASESARVSTTEKAQTIISEEESTKEKQLAQALTDELHRKKQLHDRRNKLGFDYSQMKISSADQKLLDRVVEAIRANISNSEFNVENLGDEVGISRVHLNRKLKDLIDTTPSALIKTTRLKQAAFMLTQPNVSISEVAYAVGFSTPAYFATNFTQYFGMTPKDFVSNYNKNPESEELKKLLE